MSFEEEFDRIIRKKAGESSYAFDESNWEKARAMVDADRKGDRKPAGFFYTAALIILSLGFAGWLLMEGLSGGDSLSAAVAKQESKKRMAAPQKKLTPAAQAPAVATALQQEKAIAVPPASKHQAVAETALLSGSGLKALPVNITDSEPAAQEPAVEQMAKATEAVVTPSEAPAAMLQQAPALPLADDVTPITGAEAPVITGNTEEPSVPVEAITYEPLTAIWSGLPFSSAEPGLKPLTVDKLVTFDEEYYKKDKNKSHFLNAEAGGAYLTGWDVKGGKDGKGLNWFAGINYGVYLAKKWSIGAGLQVYNVSNISKPFYNHSMTEYSFGSAATRTVITTSDLYYAAVPVKIYYAISPLSQFGAGVNVGMPVQAKSTVETFAMSDNLQTGSNKTTRSGVYEGVNTTNVMLSAFYRTQVGKRMYVSGEAIYGISDVFENLSNKNKENVAGFRLSLQYTLFDK